MKSKIPKPEGVDLGDPRIQALIDQGGKITGELKTVLMPVFYTWFKTQQAARVPAEIVLAAVCAATTDMMARALIVCHGNNNTAERVEDIVTAFSTAFPMDVSHALGDVRDRQGAKP